MDSLADAVEENKKITSVTAVDISFYIINEEGAQVEIEPAVPIRVSMSSAAIAEAEDSLVVHVDDEGAVNVVDQAEDAESAEDEVVFDSDVFSVYVIVGTEMEATLLTHDGETFLITLSCGPEAEIPQNAQLIVKEIIEGSEEYKAYCEKIAEAVNAETDTEEETAAKKSEDVEGVLADTVEGVKKARFFDITIKDEAGVNEIQPKAPVQVKIELYKPLETSDDSADMQAVHISGQNTDLLDTTVDSQTAVSFTAGSFSIYGVVTIETEGGSFTFEDDEHVITVTYTKESNLPIGARMTVREVEFGTDKYWDLWNKTIEKLNEGVEWESDGPDPDPRKGLADAAFFDVNFTYDGKPVKPDVPVQVVVRYKNEGIIAPAGENAGAVHIDGDTVELLDGVVVEYGECDSVTQQYYMGGASRAVEYSYAQKDFLITGIYTTGVYLEPEMVIFRTSAPVQRNTKALKAAKGVLPAEVPLRGEGDEPETPKPQSNKTLSSNGDGTYTLSLSVTGKASTSQEVNVNKSNVIIVMDRSNSMTQNSTWVEYTYDEDTYDPARTYRRSNANNGQ
ncbi:MAG: hypothetical protein II759_04745, partial [Lachnospiraceae bacterium]|nr:hypothetical protein [Lachnospiraceae bacterium]